MESDDEFANLRSEDVVMASDNEDPEEEPRATISYDEIQRELREVARKNDVGCFGLVLVSIIQCA